VERVNIKRGQDHGTYYAIPTSQGAAAGGTIWFVGSRVPQITRPMRKSYKMIVR
jgi:hypothetical protein